ncbi:MULTISPECIES: PH domain-containing protein [Haloferax]|uniref:Bacterial membrane flanked domain protein n=1 Tax=Haloferax massiliensis TaxID=1476858 RepID=A0A0D6JQR4_9EURY|nr:MULTISPECIES: PH domain-containing protein [Haloferax]MDS0240138.1 PH domain-containing protein [Haloferax sp. S2CR25]MDS0443259.1 PH domain-containing protein [Haloferax sp. S2CR25-2]CQR50252.1 Bacterial membrane flanked domain protein [Haloferax massiliensis]
MTDGDSRPADSPDDPAPTDSAADSVADSETVAAVDDWLARGDDETVRWAGRPRIQTVIPAAVVGAAIAVVSAAVAVVNDVPALALVALVGPLLPAWSYLRVTNTRFVVTDRALYRKTGVLSRTVQRVSLDRVQNSALSQGVTGSLFGYGTVAVEAAGGGAIRFDDVNDPGTVRDRIEGRDDRDSDEIPGTVEQWAAVRDEVRALRAAVER